MIRSIGNREVVERMSYDKAKETLNDLILEEIEMTKSLIDSGVSVENIFSLWGRTHYSGEIPEIGINEKGIKDLLILTLDYNEKMKGMIKKAKNSKASDNNFSAYSLTLTANALDEIESSL